MFSAIAVILMFFFEFALPFLPPYLKVDFGELPALISAFVLGPWWGVLVCLIKNLVCLTTTGTAGVGELYNRCIICFPCRLHLQQEENKICCSFRLLCRNYSLKHHQFLC